MLEHNPLSLVSGFDFKFNCNLVLDLFLAPDVNLKFVDGSILADNRFYRSWVDVCPPDEFHVVPPSTDTTTVKVPGATTRAGAGGHFHHHIFGAIADEGNKTSTKGGHNALAQFLITCWPV